MIKNTRSTSSSWPRATRPPPTAPGAPPCEQASRSSDGRAKSFDEKWQNHGAATLHGVTSNGFPNLFFAGPTQSASAANFVMSLDVITSHVAYIIAEAERKAGQGKRAIIETTIEAEEIHSGEIMRRAAWFGSLATCTPGYTTSEGEFAKSAHDQAAMMKAARSGGWTEGMDSFMAFLQQWRDQGALKGLTVEAVTA